MLEYYRKLQEQNKKRKQKTAPPQGKYNFYKPTNDPTQPEPQAPKLSQPTSISNFALTPQTMQKIDQIKTERPTINYNQVGQSLSKDTLSEPTPYGNRMIEALNRIQDYKPQQYDPGKDVALNIAQDQAIQKVRRGMAGRGRVFDTYAGMKEQQVAQQLIPQYYQYHRQDQQLGREDLYNQLNQLRGMQNTRFGQDVTRAGLTGQFEGGPTIPEIQRIEQNEIRDFGTVLSPQMREYREAYLNLPQDIKRQYEPLGDQDGGFATTINQLRATDPNNELIPILEIMRANKILSDPQMMEQYGIEYGMQSGAITEMAEQEVLQDVMQNLEVLKQQAQYKEYVAQIEKIQAEIQKIESEKAYKDAQIVEKEYQALQEQIKTANLPYQLQAELQSELQLAKQRSTSAMANVARAEQSRSATQTEAVKRNVLGQQSRLEEVKYQKAIQEALESRLDVLIKEDKLADMSQDKKNAVSLAMADVEQNYGGDITAWNNDQQGVDQNLLKELVKIMNDIKKNDGDSLITQILN